MAAAADGASGASPALDLIRPRLVRVDGRDEALLAAIIALEAASYPADEAATPEKLRYRAALAPDFFHSLLSDRGGTAILVGFVCGTLAAGDALRHESMASHDPSGTSLCIHSVVVAPAYRRRGIAQHMLEAYLRAVQYLQPSVRLALLLTHEHNAALYHRCGFVSRGLSSVVHGSERWLEMARPLAAAVAASGDAPPAATRRTAPFAHIDAFIVPASLRAALTAVQPASTEAPSLSGNPAAVVFVPVSPSRDQVAAMWGDGGGAAAGSGDVPLPSNGEMQALATLLRLPVTVFVVIDRDGAVHMRFFTPSAPLAFCGHGTLAAAIALHRRSWIMPLAAGDAVAPPPVTLHASGGRAVTVRMVPALLSDGEGESEEVRRLALTAADGESAAELHLPAEVGSAAASTDGDLIAALGAASSSGVLVSRSRLDALVQVTPSDFARLRPSQSALLAAVGSPRIVSVTAPGTRASHDAGADSVQCGDGYGLAIPLRWFDCVSRCWPASSAGEDAACGAAHCGIAPHWSAAGAPDRWLLAFQASPRGAVFALRTDAGGGAVVRMRGAGALIAAGVVAVSTGAVVG